MADETLKRDILDFTDDFEAFLTEIQEIKTKIENITPIKFITFEGQDFNLANVGKIDYDDNKNEISISLNGSAVKFKYNNQVDYDAKKSELQGLI